MLRWLITVNISVRESIKAERGERAKQREQDNIEKREDEERKERMRIEEEEERNERMKIENESESRRRTDENFLRNIRDTYGR